MNTIIIHIYTVIIPAVLVIISLLLFLRGIRKAKERTIRSGLILLVLNGVMTTFTSAMGGASMRVIESAPGVNVDIVLIHAWTAMLTFLLSLVIAVVAYKKMRSASAKSLKTLFILSGIFLSLFALTSILAFSIRG